MTSFVLATHNAHKLVELRRILVDAGTGYEVLGIADLPDASVVPEVEETGGTFTENAFLKATAVAAATGLPAVADDSGLEVDALNGMPGILSARWSGRHGDDQANLALVLGQLVDVPDDRRAARFVCAAVVALPEGQSRSAVGEMRGVLIRSPRGTHGFGYDPIFVPDGLAVTTAEMSAVDKDAISHRGRALRSLVALLPDLLH